MDTSHIAPNWFQKILSFQRISEMGNHDAKRRLKVYTEMLNRREGKYRNIIYQIWIYQILLWQDKRVYVHVTRRHSGVRKNKYGDKWRTYDTIEDYLGRLIAEYVKE